MLPRRTGNSDARKHILFVTTVIRSVPYRVCSAPTLSYDLLSLTYINMFPTRIIYTDMHSGYPV
ncbi:hypothetical protein SCLCIDRAFT_1212874 [Scleroderma citrinum Foug A]|uniref:Uncharacterized protein n=1 Tax=Scleroderma citrinum Foug A TaxID=1036808 RepID=A0A0C2ZTE7_9AGAM|nr:hypothetical protein SCLCIDRAFT_1212874 [Scleroderma citrinum Foug A]